jgi:hypothetical protein
VSSGYRRRDAQFRSVPAGRPCRWRIASGLGMLCAALVASRALAQTTVANVTYASGQTLTVSDPTSIYASPSVVVSSGANITFSAGALITLDPGFHAVNGSYFQALISNSGAVSNLQQTGATSTMASFSWTGSPGSNPISYFNLYRNGVLIGMNGASSLSYTDSGLNANSSYVYGVVAVDTKGNASPLFVVNINTPGPSGTLPSGNQVVLYVPANTYYGIATGNWTISSVTPH